MTSGSPSPSLSCDFSTVSRLYPLRIRTSIGTLFVPRTAAATRDGLSGRHRCDAVISTPAIVVASRHSGCSNCQRAPISAHPAVTKVLFCPVPPSPLSSSSSCATTGVVTSASPTVASTSATRTTRVPLLTSPRCRFSYSEHVGVANIIDDRWDLESDHITRFPESVSRPSSDQLPFIHGQFTVNLRRGL